MDSSNKINIEAVGNIGIGNGHPLPTDTLRVETGGKYHANICETPEKLLQVVNSNTNPEEQLKVKYSRGQLSVDTCGTPHNLIVRGSGTTTPNAKMYISPYISKEETFKRLLNRFFLRNRVVAINRLDIK